MRTVLEDYGVGSKDKSVQAKQSDLKTVVLLLVCSILMHSMALVSLPLHDWATNILNTSYAIKYI